MAKERTKIADYWASSTECSDHFLRKNNQNLSNYCRFFWLSKIKGAKHKHWRLGIIDSHTKYANWKKNFDEKLI